MAVHVPGAGLARVDDMVHYLIVKWSTARGGWSILPSCRAVEDNAAVTTLLS